MPTFEEMMAGELARLGLTSSQEQSRRMHEKALRGGVMQMFQSQPSAAVGGLSDLFRPTKGEVIGEAEEALARRPGDRMIAEKGWTPTLRGIVEGVLSPVDAETGMPNVDLGATMLTKGLNVNKGVTRLFRTGELSGNTSKLPEWLGGSPTMEAIGRWWTNKEEIADWYAKPGHGGPAAPRFFLDVPNEVAESYRVSNLKGEPLKFSRDPENEFFLPRVMLDQAKPVSEAKPHLYSQALEIADDIVSRKDVPSIIRLEGDDTTKIQRLHKLFTNYPLSRSGGQKVSAKQDELRWLGFDELVKGKDKITKDQLAQHVRDNQVHVEEFISGKPHHGGLGDNEDFTERWNRADLRTPGGSNYRERLLVWDNPPTTTSQPYPGSGLRRVDTVDYETSHWQGQHNVLAHLRTQDFTTLQGQKALHIDEVQSDWQKSLHNQALAKGDPRKSWQYEAAKILDDKGLQDLRRNALGNDDLIAMMERGENPSADFQVDTPDAPLAPKYLELTAKRALQLAVEEGKDVITWTTGKSQATRNARAMTNNVSRLEYQPAGELLTAYTKDGQSKANVVSIEELPDWVGRDVAKQLLNNIDTAKGSYRTITDFYDNSRQMDELQGTLAGSVDINEQTIGRGRGYEDIYDKQFKKEIEKWVGKFGGRVEKSNLTGEPKLPETWKSDVSEYFKSTYPGYPTAAEDFIAQSVSRNFSFGETPPEYFRRLSKESSFTPFREAAKYALSLMTKGVGEEVWQATLPPRMRDAISPKRGGKGLPLFELGAGAAMGAAMLERQRQSEKDRLSRSKADPSIY